MSEQTPDLSNLIAGEPTITSPQEDDIVEQIGKLIEDLQNSFASMHIYVRTLDQRLSSVERYVSYLLEKDPHVAAKIKELGAKAEAEKAKDGNQA